MEAYKHHVGEIKKHPKHWAYVYRHRRHKMALVSTKPIVLSQVVVIVASLFAGYLLDINKETIGLIAGAFVLLPGVVDLEATISGALTAKVNHQTLNLKAPNWFIVVYAVLISFVINIFSGLIIGIVGGLIGNLLFGASILTIVTLSVVTTTIVSLVSLPLMSLFTLLVQKVNINPDNVVGPIQGSLIDILVIVTISMVAKWLM